MKKIIYLADLMHSNFGLFYNTTPLGIGKIGTHILNKFGKEAIEVRLFRTFEDIELAVREKKPDMIGLSSYAWNENLTAASFCYFRKICPDTIFVAGGANISVYGWEQTYQPNDKDKMATQFSRTMDVQTFKIMPDVDFLVHGHGEYPVVNIVEKILGAKTNTDIKGQSIDGCTGFYQNEFVFGNPPPFPTDLDEFPSPYVTGLLDEMISKYRLPAQLETNRGCPYECSFCATGGAYNKIAKHSIDYVKEEIYWAKDNLENRVLRLSDSNFGIMEKDLEVAEFLKSLQDESGYPSAIRVYYSTIRANKRTMKISQMFDKYQPFTIGLQSETPIVLQNVVRRNNPPIEDLEKMVDFAHANGMSVGTDLIAGMPGETYESFKETTAKVIRAGYDSIYVNSLYLLKGSDLYTAQARERFKLKTMFAMMANSVTKVGDDYIIEGEEYPVETSTATHDDFWKMFKFRVFMFMIFGGGYFKEFIMHLDTYGISFLDVYEEIVSEPETYPNYNRVLNESETNASEKKLFPSMKALSDKVESVVRTESSETEGSVLEGLGFNFKIIFLVGEMLKSENKGKFIKEFTSASYLLAKKAEVYSEEFKVTTEEIADLTADIMISPIELKAETTLKHSYYDLIAWAEDGYSRKLSKFVLEEQKTIYLNIRNFKQHQDIMDRSRGLSDKEVFRIYYGEINSSNLRRWMKSTDEQKFDSSESIRTEVTEAGC